MKDLVEYMKHRAAVEKTLWDIPEELLEAQFNAGIREFFGVRLADSGRILSDGQNPSALGAYQQRVTCDCKDHDPKKSAWTGEWPDNSPKYRIVGADGIALYEGDMEGVALFAHNKTVHDLGLIDHLGLALEHVLFAQEVAPENEALRRAEVVLEEAHMVEIDDEEEEWGAEDLAS